MKETFQIDMNGHKLAAYSYGTGEQTLFILNGGPGLPCHYFLDCHLPLVEHGFRIVSYDQLGTGNSDCPDDDALWTIERYCEEVETVRQALNLKNVHLLGHSWGAVLSIEYALKYQHHLTSLILSNGVADIPFHLSEVSRLRNALGSETVTMMQKHEANGTMEHPEYQAAITILNYRHLCRLEEWPKRFIETLGEFNQHIYNVMQGPNEFYFTGNLRNWSRLEEMAAIELPAQILVGEYDELTPASAMKMYYALPNSKLHLFKNCSHLPLIESPDEYTQVVAEFMKKTAKQPMLVM